MIPLRLDNMFASYDNKIVCSRETVNAIRYTKKVKSGYIYLFDIQEAIEII